MIQERLPRRITLSTGLLLYGLLVIIAIAAALIPRFIVWNAISGVFWSFMVVMIAMSAGYGIFKTISDRLYRLGLVSSQFIVAYVSSIIPLAGSFLHRITQAGLPVGAMVILLSILHFLLVFVILKTLQQQTMSSSQKAGRLILIAALSLCFAVFVILVV